MQYISYEGGLLLMGKVAPDGGQERRGGRNIKKNERKKMGDPGLY